MIDLRRRLRALREQQEQAAAAVQPVAEKTPPVDSTSRKRRAADPVTPYDELWFEGRPIDA